MFKEINPNMMMGIVLKDVHYNVVSHSEKCVTAGTD